MSPAQELSFNVYGQGNPILILHGLFGSKDNWTTIAKKLSDQFQVWCLDQRNHGDSFHDPIMNYPVMADDIARFIDRHNLKSANIVGHSMGGKVGMALAIAHPEKVNRLIVVDIAARKYADHHSQILAGLSELDLSTITSRGEADHVLSKYLSDVSVRQFLLKNLKREETGFSWKINLDAIMAHYSDLSDFVSLPAKKCQIPTLVLKGEFSNYISLNDPAVFHEVFESVKLDEISGAGHWVHAQKPDEVVSKIRNFLS